MKRTMSKSDRIIDAAVKVIAKNGYHGAKVTAIAKEAGLRMERSICTSRIKNIS